jgi:alkyldihydroxyacetonephosphate synthase
MRRRKHWGWGYEDDAWSPQQLRAAAPGLEEHLRIAGGEVQEPVALEDVVLPAPRVAPPAALAAICATDAHARASHAWGASYADVVRGFRGRFDFPPDVVARPRGERDVEALLEWAAAANIAVVPYGGGTSVSARSRRASTARSRSTSGRWTACCRSTRSRRPPASRPARPVPRSRSSSARST